MQLGDITKLVAVGEGLMTSAPGAFTVLQDVIKVFADAKAGKVTQAEINTLMNDAAKALGQALNAK